MKVLVTGSEGFVGRHLTAALRSRGDEVIGTSASADDETRLILPDEEAARRILLSTHPDAVLHLAGITSVPAAEQDPERAYRVNVEGTASLLRAALAVVPEAHFVYVSSSSVYAPDPEESRDERSRLGPVHVYGWTKLAGECLVRAHGSRLRFTILRPFNHTGPGQSDEFVLSAFARQIAEMEAGQRPPRLDVGNLDVERDFLDVRDVVLAYERVLATEPRGRVWNISSDTGIDLRRLVEFLRARAEVELEIHVDPQRLRRRDPPRIVGNSQALRRHTGWSPRHDIQETLADLLDEWRRSLP